MDSFILFSWHLLYNCRSHSFYFLLHLITFFHSPDVLVGQGYPTAILSPTIPPPKSLFCCFHSPFSHLLSCFCSHSPIFSFIFYSNLSRLNLPSVKPTHFKYMVCWILRDILITKWHTDILITKMKIEFYPFLLAIPYVFVLFLVALEFTILLFTLSESTSNIISRIFTTACFHFLISSFVIFLSFFLLLHVI